MAPSALFSFATTILVNEPSHLRRHFVTAMTYRASCTCTATVTGQTRRNSKYYSTRRHPCIYTALTTFFCGAWRHETCFVHLLQCHNLPPTPSHPAGLLCDCLLFLLPPPSPSNFPLASRLLLLLVLVNVLVRSGNNLNELVVWRQFSLYLLISYKYHVQHN